MGKVKNFFHDEILAMQDDPMFAEFDMQHSDPFDVQVGGDHYSKYAIQPTQYIIANGLGFCQGNVVKYVTRYKDKGGIDDLKKARHYIDMLITQEEIASNGSPGVTEEQSVQGQDKVRQEENEFGDIKVRANGYPGEPSYVYPSIKDWLDRTNGVRQKEAEDYYSNLDYYYDGYLKAKGR
jgi:hypothetical protein